MELSDKGAGGTERLIVRGILLSHVWVMAGCFFCVGMGTHEPQKLFWLSFREQVTLSPGKSAKTIRKLRKLADAQTVRQFAHNAYFPKLRVTTLPPKIARRVSAVHAVLTSSSRLEASAGET